MGVYLSRCYHIIYSKVNWKFGWSVMSYMAEIGLMEWGEKKWALCYEGSKFNIYETHTYIVSQPTTPTITVSLHMHQTVRLNNNSLS